MIDTNAAEKKIALIDKVLPSMMEKMSRCDLCPRRCRVDRFAGERGFCGAASGLKVYTYSAHRGEEPPISGKNGSGTVFFSHCNMGCVYCQNFRFSHEAAGRTVSPGKLSDIMLELQSRGCHNINLVSPTHFAPPILEALRTAYQGGLRLPVVYNTGGYDSPEVIRALDGVVDVYLPDMRYSSDDMAVKYSSAPGYVENNRAIVLEMRRQAGALLLDGEGTAVKGLIIRLLILPGSVSGTVETLDFIASEIGADTQLSVMSQYYPAYKAGSFPAIARGIDKKEYEQILSAMETLGLSNGWIQPLGGGFDDAFAGENFPPGI